MGFAKSVVSVGLVVVAVVLFTASSCLGSTDPRDVEALNSLYLTLGLPALVGWEVLGGDPCGEQWQGISCVFSNVTSIKLNGVNLGGTLNEDFGLLASVIEIDLGNNNIGGSIPSSLPQTLKNFSLSGNNLSGSIPDTFSSLTQLFDLSLNNNTLSGGIPDVFEKLTVLMTLDLSGNNLTGQLPQSMGNLSALYKLHLQNNRFSGFLDVLVDLPLNDLKDGNPFNTTIIASPPIALPPSMPPAEEPSDRSSRHIPWNPYNPPSGSEKSHSARGGFLTTKRIKWIAIAGAAVLVIVAVVACILMLTCCKRKVNKDDVSHRINARKGLPEKPNYSKSSTQSNKQVKNVGKETVLKMPPDVQRASDRRIGGGANPQDEQEVHVKKVASSSRHAKDQELEMSGVDVKFTKLQPPPPPFLAVPKLAVDPITSGLATTKKRPTDNTNLSSSIKTFTIGLLQQCTNSFSEENFIGEGMVGSVYWAELPDGRLAAVKKLTTTASRLQNDDEFLDLVFKISELIHANVVKVIGYCNDHRQRLLVYEYFNNGTLYDALHVDDELHAKLSWNVRIRVALGAASALHYLHEVCQPSVVHQNFKSANILLDDKLAVGVSDCGLASLLTGSASQLSLNAYYGYGAPESESGNFTCKTDVYSFGVVLLELLTGRKSYDRSRSRGEQSLVRWAIPQLHDINALTRMVDPSLNGTYPVKSLSRFADIISRCVQFEPEFRPAISEIIQDLLPMI
ncbi:protein STRUBBELIG-RECEPTOR FAMILY 3-like isoform X2 [Tripterygium wilfordii]|uniref:protein STRUBBELIG-RECEPTOR FAMILY 3-like isoform X2 n=1 Tax=Tripterygium wilfordii TaxID=458696 RepID=UPI0018F80FDB|nr:protein STRUBBELIG-RECEPTOR FAMILY 3-like isoform X2 [Tripterygium wilfordii]